MFWLWFRHEPSWAKGILLIFSKAKFSLAEIDDLPTTYLFHLRIGSGKNQRL